MPRGRYNRARSFVDKRERERRQLLYSEHRQDMAAAGYDPDMIGLTEAPQCRCPGCGKPIPWAVLNRYR